MSAGTSSTVDPLSLAGFDTAPDRFAAEFGASFERFGFAIVTDHGIDPRLIERGWQTTAALFAQPVEEKLRYRAAKGGQRGYVPFGIEVAKGATATDLKEFWHIGRDLPAGHALAGSMPANVWPAQPPEFREVFTRLFAELDRVGTTLLSAIARWLKVAPNWFDAAVRDGNSILRLLHYPPINLDSGPGAAPAGGIRAAAHEDINLITLLLGAEEAGLELLDREGRWLAVDPPAGALVVNVGDMLQRLTNHVLPSTTHRVVNPPPERAAKSRYSMPFFLHLASDYTITTLPGCVGAGRPDRYPAPITADAYLHERLREIGLL